ncbi:MAG: NAD-dependent epimerase/dehydratase family protein [Solirubrobacterales bacterium]|nr:NAD-dependent epimerase/dehydratase family protein [Solirubrobacterales bacterium]
MRAFVTGAEGFIGRALSERLRGDGWEVAGVDFAAVPERAVVAGDVAEPGPWQRAANGAEVVVHTAAIVSNAHGLDTSWRVNVLGTRRALDAAVAAGARRFVHVSSVRAFSDLGFPPGVDESHPVRPDGNPYVDTKIASEQVVLQAHAAGEIDCVVIRPGDVYGPGSRPWTLLPLEIIRSGRFVLPARGRGTFSPVYVDDLVDGLVRAATVPEAAGEVITVSGGADVPARDFFGHYFRMLGRRGPLCLPTPVAVAGARLAGGLERLRGRETEINATSMRYLARPGGYSIAKARRLLGYEPAVGLDEGMRRTEAWLRERGLV